LSLRGVVNRRRSEGEKGSAVEGEVDGKKAGMDGPGGVPSEFEHFSGEVLEHGREVNCAQLRIRRQKRKSQFPFFTSKRREGGRTRSSLAHPPTSSLTKKTADTTDGEL
jgi:hypothetical protein